MSLTLPAQAVEGNSLDHCDEQVTLDCLRALYDFYYDLQVPDQNSIGVGRCRSHPVSSGHAR